MRKLIIALFFVVSISSSVYTNDTAGYVLPTGGVVFEKQNGIKMQTEALYIRPGQIEVNYLFENTTDKDITTHIFFPLPPIPAVSDVYGEYAQAQHQFNFKLWVNGKRKKYQTYFSLKQTTKELPPFARQLWKVPEESLDEDQFHRRIDALPQKQRQALLDGGYVSWGWTSIRNSNTQEMADSKGWTITETDEAMWWKYISYSWRQTFPAHRTVHIRHTYTPSFKTTNTGAPFSSCIDKESETYQRFINSSDEQTALEPLEARNYLEYILTTAKNWQGPIENFNLLVQSPLKSVGCFDGKSFYGEKYYTVNRTHYTPERDLSVDFVVASPLPRGYSPKTVPALYRLDNTANLYQEPRGKIIGYLQGKTHVWAWPQERQGPWVPVRQNDLFGYIDQANLIKVF